MLGTAINNYSSSVLLAMMIHAATQAVHNECKSLKPQLSAKPKLCLPGAGVAIPTWHKVDRIVIISPMLDSSYVYCEGSCAF